MRKETDAVLKKAAKIKKLLESEKDIGNEEAAQNMAAILQQLLARHRLTMSQVIAATNGADEGIVQEDILWEDYDLKTKKARCGWRERLAHIIARANGCQEVVRTRSNVISFVGRESSAQIACYMLGVLVRTVEHITYYESRRLYGKLRRERGYGGAFPEMQGWAPAFRVGFITRIRERLDESMSAQQASDGTAEPGTALMVLRNDLIAAKAWMAKSQRFGKSPRTSMRHSANPRGYARGVEVANGVDLGSKKTAVGKRDRIGG